MKKREEMMPRYLDGSLKKQLYLDYLTKRVEKKQEGK